MRPTSTRSAKRGASRGPKSSRREDDDEIPAVYREMLAEAEARDPSAFDPQRQVKRRKVDGPETTVPTAPQVDHNASEDASRRVQTVYDSPSDESDMEWEDVNLQAHPASQEEPSVAFPAPGDEEPMQITLGQPEDHQRQVVPRRKPVSAAEKKLRLDVHKVHLLCLLRHVQIRNVWCNDDEVQGFLKKMLSKQTISLLNPSEDKPQYIRSTTFIDGLNQASDAFMKRFRVTATGMRRPHWAEDPSLVKQEAESIISEAEIFLSRDDFRKEARTLQGSRDFGAQLFCALLRSVAVEARLVCSLQPLPFSGSVKTATPSKPAVEYITISSDDRETSTDDRTKPKTGTTSRSRRLGQPQFKSPRAQKTSAPASRPIRRESPYPVFWVEAFNEAVQKWIPIDPLVTKSLAKTFKFEPPSTDLHNCMSYVVGFEEDASARDITRRYAKAFNAKTRKLRVESTRNGEQWWERALRLYEKPFLDDRDEKEISELTSKSAAEPMPRNVQDFKDHPFYALERHLRRNEVIHPKRVIGQVGLGKAGSKNEKLDPVYRRSDVHIVRSADKWYRLGRDIKMGEQPLKRVQARQNKTMAFHDDDDLDSPMETPLYAYHQTEVYTPPPVVGGKVPKNTYGNLDIYVPSMVPAGGTHIKHPNAAYAARVLGIDYSDAVTGFDFKGRQGTAVFQGIVIANEYREALEEIIGCLEDEKQAAQEEARSAEAIEMWKRFLLRLRIAERVNAYAIEGGEVDEEVDEEPDDEAEDAGGGFFPEPGAEVARPTGGMNGGGFLEEASAGGSPSQCQPSSPAPEGEFGGGGFIPEGSNDHRAPSPPLHAPGPHATSSPAAHSRYSLVVVSDHKKTNTEPVDPQENTYPSTKGAELEIKSQDASESSKPHEGGSFQAPITVESADSKSNSVEIVSGPASQSQSRRPSAAASANGSETDKGSLLSQDPDDEDAVPEWLMSESE